MKHTPDKLILIRGTAADPKTPPEQLSVLANIVNIPTILRYIAENTITPLEVLYKLIDHPSSEVRIGLADNCNTPLDLILRLAKDQCPEVRYSLAENHNIPIEIIKILIDDENPWIATRATRTLERINDYILLAGKEVLGHRVSEKTNVLIAEDNEFIRSLIKRVVEKDEELNIICETGNGAKTVDNCLRLKPDVVLMDLSMPDMNGVEATKVIKKQTPDIKVIVVTGSDSKQDINNAFKAGADGYFLKSTPFTELPKCIKTVSANASWLDPGISSIVLNEFFRTESPKDSQPESNEIDYSSALKALFKQIDSAINDSIIEDALILAQAAVKLSERVYGLSSKMTSEALAKLGDLHHLKGEFKESESVLLKAIETYEPQLGKADENTDYVLTYLGKIAEEEGRYQQAELFYTWSLRIRERQGDSKKIHEAESKLEKLPG